MYVKCIQITDNTLSKALKLLSMNPKCDDRFDGIYLNDACFVKNLGFNAFFNINLASYIEIN